MWTKAISSADSICAVAEKDRLDRVHGAATRLRDQLSESRTAARGGAPGPVHAVRLLTAGRALARELDILESLGVLPDGQDERMLAELDGVAGLLGTDVEDLTERARGPRWLEVASPAHGSVDAERRWGRFNAEYVDARRAGTVVIADHCEFEATDRYGVDRLSVDASSIYDDRGALEALADVLDNPSRETVRALRNHLERITASVPEAGDQRYRQKLSERTRTEVSESDVVIAGDGADLHGTTRYHVREVTVPLAELLLEREDLIWALAGRDPANSDRQDREAVQRPILAALREIGDDTLLRHTGRTDGATTVRQVFRGTEVDLAAAVMIGAGNHLTRVSEVDRGHTRDGDLARFHRCLQDTRAARAAERAEQVQHARAAEQARLASAARVAELARTRQARAAEQHRLAEQERAAKQARLAEQGRLAERERLAKRERLAELERAAELARQAQEAVRDEHAELDDPTRDFFGRGMGL
ncbi:hypothetical protein ACPCHT_27960 [Nucisporomicrobium flavum]|uniref:hypothetical protein n=1 Tax=Nucisporomicrobium flavum TaxID=2785915 RepID=UPI003C2EC6E3